MNAQTTTDERRIAEVKKLKFIPYDFPQYPPVMAGIIYREADFNNYFIATIAEHSKLIMYQNKRAFCDIIS